MKIPITREIKIHLLSALKRGYFTEDESMELYRAIYKNIDSLMSLKRFGEIVDAVKEANDAIGYNPQESISINNKQLEQ
ncbi:MAG: hypothetical protein SNI45_03510 [Rikenellaceae bacterium]